MLRSHRVCCVAVSGALLAAIGVLGALYGMPALLRKLIIDSVVLRSDSDALARWTVTPQPLNFFIYVFHVENPEEVSKGARPILTEKGPYVYDLFRERVDVQFHDEDDSVSYFDKSTYRFNQEKSGCRTENDMVTILNAPILVDLNGLRLGLPHGAQSRTLIRRNPSIGTGLMLNKIMPMAISIFDQALPSLFGAKDVFIRAKVRDVLFDGVLINCSYPLTDFPVGPVCQGMRSRAPVTFRRDKQNYYFSMINHMNGTSKTRVRISRGQRDPSSLGKILQYGNGTTLDTWRRGSPCNMINGTDTTIFHPFINPAQPIPIFQSGSCRSMFATFEHPTEVHGVPALRFIADRNMLASGRDYKSNRCFCEAPSEDGDGESQSKTGGGNAASRPSSPNEGDSSTGEGANAGASSDSNTGGGKNEGTGSSDLNSGDGANENNATDSNTVANEATQHEGVDEKTFRRKRTTNWDEGDSRSKRETSKEEKDASKCLPKGALDMTKCLGSPVVLTLPHFYLGAPEFLEYAIGLQPNKSKHETYVMIEPITGIPLQGGKRVQLNMFLTKIDGLQVLSSVSEGLFPILWIEEGVSLEGHSVDQMVAAHRKLSLLRASPWIISGVGAFLLLCSALLRAHYQGLFSRILARAEARAVARVHAKSTDAPSSGLPPGNYGVALGFGPPTDDYIRKAKMLGGGNANAGLRMGMAGFEEHHFGQMVEDGSVLGSHSFRRDLYPESQVLESA